jgi:hypothetical protein
MRFLFSSTGHNYRLQVDHQHRYIALGTILSEYDISVNVSALLVFIGKF